MLSLDQPLTGGFLMAEKRTDNVVLSVRVSRETKALIAKHAANTQSHGALVDRAIQAYVKNHK